MGEYIDYFDSYKGKCFIDSKTYFLASLFAQSDVLVEISFRNG